MKTPKLTQRQIQRRAALVYALAFVLGVAVLAFAFTHSPALDAMFRRAGW